jgi:hypothetical protein
MGMSIAPISSERGVFSKGGVRLFDQGKGAPAFAGRAGVNQAIAARRPGPSGFHPWRSF